MSRRHPSAVMARARRPLLVALLAVLVGGGHAAHGNGIHVPQGADEPPTRFERFVLHECSPCVKEGHAVAVVAAPPLKLAMIARMAPGQMTRAGEISVDVERAYQLGRPTRQRLALRVTLWVSTGAAGEMYRMATGLLDDEDVGVLGEAIAEMSKAMPIAPAPGGESVEIGFHGGSLRVGVVHLRSETIAYVQAGDVPRLALRPVWEVPTTLYLSATQLPALASVVGQGAAKVQKLRGGP